MSSLNITVIGAGNAGTTVAADLSFKGHKVTLLKSSHSHSNHFNKLCSNGGVVQVEDLDKTYSAKLLKVTTAMEDALTDQTDLIIIFIQTNYHEELIKRIAPYLHNDQVILIEPGYLSTAYFNKYCSQKKLIIAEAESSPIDCRIVGNGKVKVLFKNIRNPIGIYPDSRKDEAMKILDELDYHFTLLDSVVEAALHNPNLIVHTVGAIMSIPRIEYTRGNNYWMYREVFTPSVWNLVERLDDEKMAVLKALRLNPLPYVEACKFRNSKDLSVDAKQVFFQYARNHSPSGPTISNSRYVTEDVPEGLVLLESLGQVLGISTKVCSSLINIASACLQVDFRKEGRTVERLGYENIMKIIEFH